MSKKTLVIVESPAKSSTISKYLGADYIVSSSMGHIRDLSPHILSIDVNKDYKPYYEELKDKKKIITDLKKMARKCDRILLAPDPDREGEAIAYHLREVLKEINDSIYRVFFNEITKQSILQAIENPILIDENKFNSQQMRRLLDRLAGYKISPVLQKKIGGPLSAGRVQSIALKLIVEREKEIMAFEPEEFWTITSDLEGSVNPTFNAKLEKQSGKKIKIKNQEESDKIVSELKTGDFVLEDVKKRKKKRKSQAPLITSTLQQEAYRKFSFPVKSTMKIAQELYEGISLKGGETTGLITYMRTDSHRIAKEAYAEAKTFIQKNFGDDYVPAKQNQYGKKSKIQDAHEAIRPTLPLHRPEDLKNILNERQFKLYKLIWDRFIASQMSDAVIAETVFDIKNSKYTFIIKGEIISFPGHLSIIKPQSKTEELPELKAGEVLKALSINPKQNFTKPPARFTEASIVKVLEEKGIGRPSTYATIIDTLGKRDYIRREDRKFVPSDIGIKVADYMDDNFKDIMNYNFTAELEKKLDLVSEGNLDWVEGIDDFYKKLIKDLDQVKNAEKVSLLIGKKCPECGKELTKKYSYKTRGWFVGCTGYPSCKYIEKADSLNQPDTKEEVTDEKCPKCSSNLVKRYSSKTRSYFIGCSGFPKCDYIKNIDENLGDCPQCEKPMVKRYSPKRRRHFVACSGYPECKYIQSDRKTPKESQPENSGATANE